MKVKRKIVKRISDACLQELQHVSIEAGANVAESVTAALHITRVTLSSQINSTEPKHRAYVRLSVLRAIQSLMLQVNGDTVPN